MVTDSLNLFSWPSQFHVSDGKVPYRLIPYPKGSSNPTQSFKLP